jgi:hypothetical protein
LKHISQSPKNQPTEKCIQASKAGIVLNGQWVLIVCHAAKRTALRSIEPSYKSTRDGIANGDWNQVLDQDVTPAQRST